MDCLGKQYGKLTDCHFCMVKSSCLKERSRLQRVKIERSKARKRKMKK